MPPVVDFVAIAAICITLIGPKRIGHGIQHMFHKHKIEQPKVRP